MSPAVHRCLLAAALAALTSGCHQSSSPVERLVAQECVWSFAVGCPRLRLAQAERGLLAVVVHECWPELLVTAHIVAPPGESPPWCEIVRAIEEGDHDLEVVAAGWEPPEALDPELAVDAIDPSDGTLLRLQLGALGYTRCEHDAACAFHP